VSLRGFPLAALARNLLAGALLSAVAAAAEIPTPSALADPPTAVDDDAIVQHVEEAGTALIRSGKTVKLKTLRSQLQRVHACALDLPALDDAPQSPRDIYERRANGVLVVGILSKQKKHPKYELAGCSGFALTTDGVFVTNYHVVDNPEGETLVVMTREGQVTPVMEVLAADKLADVAILRSPGAVFSPIPLALEAPPAGSPVWVISHPDHNFFSITNGMVSRHFMAATEYGRTPQMAITADFGAGSSGGPILNAHGQVTGMVCSTTSVYWEDEKQKISDLQMVFKHCVPVRSIRQLIGPAKDGAELGRADAIPAAPAAKP
jgi:S1-C subfamily serine protease